MDTDGWVLTIEATYLRQINTRLSELSPGLSGMLWPPKARSQGDYVVCC